MSLKIELKAIEELFFYFTYMKILVRYYLL